MYWENGGKTVRSPHFIRKLLQPPEYSRSDAKNVPDFGRTLTCPDDEADEEALEEADRFEAKHNFRSTLGQIFPPPSILLEVPTGSKNKADWSCRHIHEMWTVFVPDVRRGMVILATIILILIVLVYRAEARRRKREKLAAEKARELEELKRLKNEAKKEMKKKLKLIKEQAGQKDLGLGAADLDDDFDADKHDKRMEE
jgi:hypothetical protein